MSEWVKDQYVQREVSKSITNRKELCHLSIVFRFPKRILIIFTLKGNVARQNDYTKLNNKIIKIIKSAFIAKRIVLYYPSWLSLIVAHPGWDWTYPEVTGNNYLIQSKTVYRKFVFLSKFIDKKWRKKVFRNILSYFIMTNKYWFRV